MDKAIQYESPLDQHDYTIPSPDLESCKDIPMDVTNGAIISDQEPHKFVLKGLPLTPPQEIQRYMLKHGIKISNISRMTSKKAPKSSAKVCLQRNATNSPVDFEKNPHHQQHKNRDWTFRGKSQASYSSKPKLHAKLTSLESNSATPSQEQSLRYSSNPQDMFKTSPSSHGLNSILQDSMETLDQSANRTLSLAQSGLYHFFFFLSLLQLREYSLSWFLGMRFFQLIG